MLQHLAGSPVTPSRFATRALILAPTRELALQIEESLLRLGSQQRRADRRDPRRRRAASRRCSGCAGGADIVVGTPGRICDLMATGELRLNEVTHFVLDEADRMLDLGFIPRHPPDRRRAAGTSGSRRCSPPPCRRRSPSWPKRCCATRCGSTSPSRAPAQLPIEQHVHFVDTAGKRALLGRVADRSGDVARHRLHPHQAAADRVAETLDTGGVRVSAIHGNKSQPARIKALEQFRTGRARVLVATDIAARGIDVTGISHVINFDLPAQPEDYVHRIGRTARAGASGVAISFCDAAEHGTLRAIERMTGTPITVDDGHGYHAELVARLYAQPGRGGSAAPARPRQGGGGRPQGGKPAAAKPQSGAHPAGRAHARGR